MRLSEEAYNLLSNKFYFPCYSFLDVADGLSPVTHKGLQRETACLAKHKPNGVMQTHLQT